MNFSQKVKREITHREIMVPCCVTSVCYGIACFSKHFDDKGIVLHTERAYIAQWAKSMFSKAGIRGKVFVKGGQAGKIYEFAVKEPFEVEKMLAMFGHSGDETAVRIKFENLLCEKCMSVFTAAAFLCIGTIVNPEKGYTMEFVSGRYQLICDFESLLLEKGFLPKRTVRKGANVLYFKSSEQIEDLLTFMGATKAALEIMNLKVYKDFRNKANRITNCETANIDKMVSANQKVLRAIAVLEENDAMGTLPQPLQYAAELRKQNPEISLADLAELSEEPVSKSGLNHRLTKICKIAEKINKIQDKQ